MNKTAIRMAMAAAMATAAVAAAAQTKSVGGKEYVWLTQPDTNLAIGQNSFTLGTRWSDGLAPHGDADYLVDLGPDKWLIAHGNDLPFNGKSLTLGNDETGAEGWMRSVYHRDLVVGEFHLVAGRILFASGAWSGIGNSRLIVESGEANPFVFEMERGAELQFHSTASISGAAGTMLELRAKSEGGQETKFRVDNCGALAEYNGKIRVLGTNVWWYVNWPIPGDLPAEWLGPNPAELVPDRITLDNGGGFGIADAHQHAMDMGNRGVTVGPGGGCLKWGRSRLFSGKVSGPGVLSIKDGAYLRRCEFNCGGVRILSGTSVMFGPEAKIGPETRVEIESNGWLESRENGMEMAVALQGGSGIRCGVGAGGRWWNYGTIKLDRQSNGIVGTVTLKPGTVFDGVDASSPVRLAVESGDDGKDYVSGMYGGRVPLLRIPAEVATVSAEMFEYVPGASGVQRRIEVETEAGMQTVYAVNSVEVEVNPGDDAAAAITGATVGAVVRVRPGVYATEAAITVPEGVVVVGDDGSGEPRPDLVVFDGGWTEADGGGHRVFNLTNAGSGLYGITVRNGFEPGSGGGVYVNKGSCGIGHCIITNCQAGVASSNNGTGGGIVVSQANILVSDTVVADCRAGNGGGVYVSLVGGVSAYPAYPNNEPVFRNCLFAGNLAIKADASASGGAIASANSGSRVWLEGCTFTGNAAVSTTGTSGSARMGGALQVNGYATVTNCIFDGNGTTMRGTVNGGPVRVLGCIFRNNQAKLFGDTVDLVENCIITNNLASPVHCATTVYRNCLYADNAQPFNVLNCRLENCTVAGNRNGGITIDGVYTPTLVNVISAHNEGTTGGGYFGNANLKVWQLQPIGNMAVSNCCIQGFAEYANAKVKDAEGNPETWNIAALDPSGKSTVADPQSVDPANGDWRLKRISPCRDAGLMLDWMTVSSVDLDGLPRVVSAGKDLSRNPAALPDMGCYENQQGAPGLLLILR